MSQKITVLFHYLLGDFWQKLHWGVYLPPVAGTKVKTRTYIPLVVRCYKCQKYGHIAVNCRKETPTCPVCSGPHSFAECQTKDDKTCANCGGAHSASFRDCPRYILAEKVTHRAGTEHMSYRDALLRLRQEEEQTDSNKRVHLQSKLVKPTRSLLPQRSTQVRSMMQLTLM